MKSFHLIGLVLLSLCLSAFAQRSAMMPPFTPKVSNPIVSEMSPPNFPPMSNLQAALEESPFDAEMRKIADRKEKERLSVIGSGDELLRNSYAAVNGKFPGAASWRLWWYKWAWEHPTKPKVCKQTWFGPWDPAWMYGGPYFTWTDGKSHRLHDGICAANPEIPRGSIIMLTKGIFMVGDRGGWVTLGRACGASANIDVWVFHRRDDDSDHCPYRILRWGYGDGSHSPSLDSS